MKWIIRYLNGTLNCGRVYGRSKGRNDRLWGYVDSDYASDLDRRRSLTSYVLCSMDLLSIEKLYYNM